VVVRMMARSETGPSDGKLILGNTEFCSIAILTKVNPHEHKR